MSHKISKKSLGIFFLFTIVLFNSPSWAQTDKKENTTTENKTKTIIDENTEIPFEKLLEEELNRDAAASTTEPVSTNWAFQVFKTIIGLGFILFIIFLFKKYMVFKTSFGTVDNDIIKLLHEYPIGTGKKMQLIEIGNKILLVGVSDAGIQLISEFKEKASIDQIKMSVASQQKVEKPDFWIESSKVISNKIQNLLKGRKNFSSFGEIDSKDWSQIQGSARNKINELREKKKAFEDKDKFDDSLF